MSNMEVFPTQDRHVAKGKCVVVSHVHILFKWVEQLQMISARTTHCCMSSIFYECKSHIHSLTGWEHDHPQSTPELASLGSASGTQQARVQTNKTFVLMIMTNIGIKVLPLETYFSSLWPWRIKMTLTPPPSPPPPSYPQPCLSLQIHTYEDMFR